MAGYYKSGGQGEATSINQSNVYKYGGTDADDLLPMPQMGFEPDVTLQFKKVPTLWILLLQPLLLIAVDVLLFLDFNTDFFPVTGADSHFLFCVLLHVFVFLIVVLAERYVQHYQRRARLMGYLEFYRKTRTLRKVPSLILSLGNAAILILMSLWPTAVEYAGFARINVLQVIVTAELVVCAPAFLLLIFRTWQFNAARPRPDAAAMLAPSFEPASKLLAAPQQSGGAGAPPTHVELGFGGGGGDEYYNDVMERQADMIKYLQQQKESLSLNIVQLTDRLRRYEQSALEPTESDFQNLLKAKDQEMRAALAERDERIRALEQQVARQASPAVEASD